MDTKQLVSTMWAAEELPLQWLQGDDKCDCTFQRIGEWGNPYIGKSLQIRLCCIWAELAKMFPEFVQEAPVYWDRNHLQPTVGPQDWDSEDADMPLSIWYRQLATQQGRPLAEIRDEYQSRQQLRPRKVPRGAGRESRQPDVQGVREALLDRMERTGWRRADVIAQFDREDAESQARGEHDAKGG